MNPEIEQLRAEVADLSYKINQLMRVDRYEFNRPIAHTANAKLGFFGYAPVSQGQSTGEVSGAAGGTTNPIYVESTFNGNNGATAYTVLDIVKHLKNYGLLKK